MQQFRIMEGAFSLPEGFIDRTTHVYMYPSRDRKEMINNLTINRETLKDPLTMDDYLAKQIKLMKDNLYKFTEIARVPAFLGGEVHKNEGVALSSKFLSGKDWIYQKQAAFFLSPQDVIIFTLSAKALNTETDQLWQSWLESFTFHA